jgi:outer membrane protein assembly factor BamE (lipoprotein component of BamABCDE complex)
MRIILVLCFLGLSACTTLLERDSRSGYSRSDAPIESVREFYQDRDSKEESEARDELGYSGRGLNEQERTRLDQRLHLRRMEAQLESKRDKKQYFGVRGALRSDNERMYFLSLPNFETKQRWLQNRGYLKEETAYPENVAKTIEAQDIALGMSQKAVRESWGDPDFVENAGDPMYGYERWNYHRFTPGSDGYQKENRTVYFESGRVVGWETAAN